MRSGMAPATATVNSKRLVSVPVSSCVVAGTLVRGGAGACGMVLTQTKCHLFIQRPISLWRSTLYSLSVDSSRWLVVRSLLFITYRYLLHHLAVRLLICHFVHSRVKYSLRLIRCNSHRFGHAQSHFSRNNRQLYIGRSPNRRRTARSHESHVA